MKFTMEKVHVDRLQKLRKELNSWNSSAQSAVHFNMESWFFEDHDCGTVCCAIGFAARNIPEFQDAGFSLTEGDYSLPRFVDGDEEYTNWRAVAEFFGINDFVAQMLFDPDSYETRDYEVSPSTVAARIGEFLGSVTVE